MAGRVEAFPGVAGLNLYAFFIDSDNNTIWNGSAFESWNDANWTDYDVALSENTNSGYYGVAVPAGINTAKRLTVLIYRRLAGTPAIGDEGYGNFTQQWTGSSWGEASTGVDVISINGVAAAAVKLAISAGTIVAGKAVAGTLSVSQMTTDLTYTIANLLVGRVIYFTSGDLLGRVAAISAYVVAGGKLTFFNPLPQAPEADDEFVVI